MKNIIKLSIIFALLAFSTGCAQEEPVVEQDFTKHEKGFTEGGATWSANLTASPVEEQKVGDQSFSSSTKASVSWVHTSMIMEAYKIIATDTTNNSTITVTVDGGQTSTELTGLKASTTYEIIGYGCMNAQCEDPLFSDPTSFTTDEEV